MSQCVMVVCVDCAGTGYGHGIPLCPYCLGQGHMLVDRDHDGNLPDQAREWKVRDLGPVPYNPWVPYAR